MEDFRSKMKSDQFDKNYEDWDNEESWIEIELRLPKNRKRRVWFVVFGIGLVIAFTFTLKTKLNSIIDTDYSLERNEYLSKSNKTELDNSQIIHSSELTDYQEISNRKKEKDNKKTFTNTTQNDQPKYSLIQKKAYPQTEQSLTIENNDDNPPKVSFNKTAKNLAFIKDRLITSTKESNTVEVSREEDETIARIKVSPIPHIRDSKLLLLQIKKKNHLLPISSLLTANKSQNWAITVEGGAGRFRKTTRPTSQDSRELVDLRNAIETPEEFFYFEVRGQRQITNWGLSAYAGISYNQYNERLFYKYSSERERQVSSSQANYIELLDGSKFYLPGFLIERTIIDGEINKYNETRFLKAPFGLTYEKRIGRVTLGAHVGSFLTLYSNVTGDIVLTDNQVTNKRDLGHSKTDVFSLNRYKTGIRIGMHLNERFEITTSIDHTIDKISIEGIHGMEEEFKSIIFGLGFTTFFE